MTDKPTTGARKTDLAKLLTRLKACDEARRWAKPYATLAEAWAACTRPDWMLWLVGEMDGCYSPRLRLVVCALARTALQYVPAGEDRPRLAIECAERFARGEATAEELAAAEAAAEAEHCTIIRTMIPDPLEGVGK